MGEFYHVTLFADLEAKPEEAAQRDAVIERIQKSFCSNTHYHGGTFASEVEHYRTHHGEDIKRLTHVCHVKTREHDALLDAIQDLEPFVRRYGLMGYIAAPNRDDIDVFWNDYDRGVVVGSLSEFQKRNSEDEL